jgi:hypothetical protein
MSGRSAKLQGNRSLRIDHASSQTETGANGHQMRSAYGLPDITSSCLGNLGTSPFHSCYTPHDRRARCIQEFHGSQHAALRASAGTRGPRRNSALDLAPDCLVAISALLWPAATKAQTGILVRKVGMDPREVVARFESEREALAVMDHPRWPRFSMPAPRRKRR